VLLKIAVAGVVKMQDVEYACVMLDWKRDDLQSGMVEWGCGVMRCQKGDIDSRVTELLGDLPGVLFKAADPMELAFNKSELIH
jgi:hypothetical protein